MKRTSFTRQNFDQNGIIRSILSIFLPWLETWQDRTTSIAQTTNCSTASTSISSSRRFTSDRDSKQGHSETDVRSDVRLEATKNWITGGRAEGGREETFSGWYDSSTPATALNLNPWVSVAVWPCSSDSVTLFRTNSQFTFHFVYEMRNK